MRIAGHGLTPFVAQPVSAGFREKATNAPMYTDMLEVYTLAMPGVWFCNTLVDKSEFLKSAEPQSAED